MWKVISIRIDGSQVCKRHVPKGAIFLSVALVNHSLIVYAQVLTDEVEMQEVIFCTVGTNGKLPNVPLVYIGSTGCELPEMYRNEKNEGMVTHHVFQRMF